MNYDNKLVVYTVVAGGYDNVKPVRFSNRNVDFVLVSDVVVDVPSGWKLKVIEKGSLTNISFNRLYKMRPDILFQDYDFSLYIDGNIELCNDCYSLVTSSLKNSSICLYEHPVRNTVHEESQELIRVGYDYFWNINSHLKFLNSKRYIDDRLFEANILMRKHTDRKVIEAMTCWNHMFETTVKRDQMSFKYACNKVGLDIKCLGRSDARFGNKYFKYHHRTATRNASVNYLAKAINFLYLRVNKIYAL